MASKKYSINWENDEPVSFEVNGVLYQSPDQIADEADRKKLTRRRPRMLRKSSRVSSRGLL